MESMFFMAATIGFVNKDNMHGRNDDMISVWLSSLCDIKAIMRTNIVNKTSLYCYHLYNDTSVILIYSYLKRKTYNAYRVLYVLTNLIAYGNVDSSFYNTNTKPKIP